MLVEESAALEEAEHATLERALDALHVVGIEVRRLMKGGAVIVAVALGEDASSGMSRWRSLTSLEEPPEEALAVLRVRAPG